MKALNNYFKKRINAIGILLRRPGQKFTPENYHQLRLEIKKMNALFDLVNYCSKDFKRKNNFKPFQLIFHQSGKVRELLVEEARLKRVLRAGQLRDYRRKLKMLRLKEEDAFFRLVDKKFLMNVEKKAHEAAPSLKKVSRKKAVAYLQKKEKAIKKLVDKGNLKPPQLHLLRRQLKQLNYNRKSLSLLPPGKLPAGEMKLPLLLGKWHDCLVISGHLVKALESGTVNPSEIRQLSGIRLKFAATEKELMGKINRELKKSVWSGGKG